MATPTTIPIKVLLLTKTRGFRHDCVPALVSAIRSFQFSVHVTEDSAELLSLSDYDVVVLAHNTGEYLTSAEVDALGTSIEKGLGVVGIHAATSGMAYNKQYSAILGEVFDGHPIAQWGRIILEDDSHYISRSTSLPTVDSAPSSAPPPSLTAKSPDSFLWFDEFYNFKSHPRNVEGRRILLSVDGSTYEGAKWADQPLSWCHEMKKGRVFYTALGHFDEAYQDAWFLDILQRSIIWAAKEDK